MISFLKQVLDLPLTLDDIMVESYDITLYTLLEEIAIGNIISNVDLTKINKLIYEELYSVTDGHVPYTDENDMAIYYEFEDADMLRDALLKNYIRGLKEYSFKHRDFTLRQAMEYHNTLMDYNERLIFTNTPINFIDIYKIFDIETLIVCRWDHTQHP